MLETWKFEVIHILTSFLAVVAAGRPPPFVPFPAWISFCHENNGVAGHVTRYSASSCIETYTTCSLVDSACTRSNRSMSLSRSLASLAIDRFVSLRQCSKLWRSCNIQYKRTILDVMHWDAVIQRQEMACTDVIKHCVHNVSRDGRWFGGCASPAQRCTIFFMLFTQQSGERARGGRVKAPIGHGPRKKTLAAKFKKMAVDDRITFPVISIHSLTHSLPLLSLPQNTVQWVAHATHLDNY